MERPIGFIKMIESDLLSERRHLIMPPTNFDEAKANVVYAKDRFIEFFNERNLRDTSNYLFLVNNHGQIQQYGKIKERAENFCELRRRAVFGLARYFLLKDSMPTTEGIDDWEELEKVKLLIDHLSAGYAGVFENLQISELSTKDDSLLNLIFDR